MSIRTIDDLKAAARIARDLGHCIAITPDEADAIVAAYLAERQHGDRQFEAGIGHMTRAMENGAVARAARIPPQPEDTGDVT